MIATPAPIPPPLGIGAEWLLDPPQVARLKALAVLSNEDVLQTLLHRTSRTFALAIPLLPVPTRWEVNLAYLLFRVADTIEDSPFLSQSDKQVVLRHYREVLATANAASSVRPRSLGWSRPVSEDPHCQQLVDALPFLLECVPSLRARAWRTVAESLDTALSGMERFVAAGPADGSIHIRCESDLRDYCYCVAGLVGEMLTRLFGLDTHAPASVLHGLRQRARWFGEGLQLVNIVKDMDVDADAGRRFIPEGLPVDRVIEWARQDLRLAEEYVALLRQTHAEAGWIAFTEMPLALAWRTLDYVSRDGPGSKVPRSEVAELLSQIRSKLERTEEATTPTL